MADTKGKRTPWFPRSIKPARPGIYECGVAITNAQRTLMLFDLEWDGIGFKVPVPMMVKQWRGLTKPEAQPKGGKP